MPSSSFLACFQCLGQSLTLLRRHCFLESTIRFPFSSNRSSVPNCKNSTSMLSSIFLLSSSPNALLSLSAPSRIEPGLQFHLNPDVIHTFVLLENDPVFFTEKIKGSNRIFDGNGIDEHALHFQ